MENNNLPQAQRPVMSPLKAFNATLTNARTQDYLQQVLGAKKASFVNNITALVANSTALQACEPMSLIYACIKATALDLPLDQNLGMAHVIPYKNGKTGKQEAQLQLGYRAFIQLAIRSGQFQTINVNDVREGEIIDEDIISGEIKIPCTSCFYCTAVCPQNIAIPQYFALYNRQDATSEEYSRLDCEFGKASDCIVCGQCEKICPQQLSICKLLRDVADRFE